MKFFKQKHNRRVYRNLVVERIARTQLIIMYTRIIDKITDSPETREWITQSCSW